MGMSILLRWIGRLDGSDRTWVTGGRGRNRGSRAMTVLGVANDQMDGLLIWCSKLCSSGSERAHL